MTKLFLDDYRQPIDCVGYMHQRIGIKNPIYLENDWVIVKHYAAFVNHIKENGLPDLISFDHDLAEGVFHKTMIDGVIDYEAPEFDTNHFKTGYHCAQWLIDYCIEKQEKLPEFIVHSMNPVGTENILSILTQYKYHESGT